MGVNKYSEYVLCLLMQTNDWGTLALQQLTKESSGLKVRAEIIEQQGDTHSHPAQQSCPPWSTPVRLRNRCLWYQMDLSGLSEAALQWYEHESAREPGCERWWTALLDARWTSAGSEIKQYTCKICSASHIYMQRNTMCLPKCHGNIADKLSQQLETNNLISGKC